MINLTDIPAAVLENRGAYSTVRAAHEDCKRSLQMLCGQLSTAATQILRRMQPDNDDVPASVDELISTAHTTINLMESCVQQIESLARQRAELKPLAWPKGGA